MIGGVGGDSQWGENATVRLKKRNKPIKAGKQGLERGEGIM